ncbi:MAG: VWA domain-containing protein [Planctomycetia bacterium]|nr:VWA domain-containing protein [Planctomycetia bacterium]
MSAATPPAKNASPEAQPEPEAEEEELIETGPGLGRNVVWGLAAGGSSMVVHLALLLMMGLMMSGAPPREPPKLIEASVEPVRDQEEITQKLDSKIVPSTTLNAASSVSSAASATAGVSGAISSAVAAPKLNTTVVNRPTSVRVDVGAVNVFTQSGSTFASAVPEGTLGDGLATAEGYGDAMDRMTQEVLNMLAKRKVMLVWLMDQSESMQDDREEVTTRIERVYQELGLSAAAKDDALLTGVISYGASTLNHTPQATYKPQEIMAAIKSVPNDPSGFEMQSQAFMFGINSFQKIAQAGNRQMAMIMVTDESGDMASNISQLEQAIAMVKAANCKVYILGREAIFGYPYAHMRWTDPATKTSHWLRIDRGPETPQPEQLQINGFHRRNDAFPSGFGPYEQSRIARQTGGIFFMLPSPEVNLHGRDTRAYDSDAMRPYLPDLSPRNDYMSERDKNPLRQMVFQVIQDLNPYQAGSKGSRVEISTGPFSIDRSVFAQQTTAEMKKAQDLIMYLQEAQKGLESVASYRAREKSPRWRANYDLIYAQVISYQARLLEYGWYMGEFQKTPKAIKNILGEARPTNRWGMSVVKRLLKPDVTQAQRDKADGLFREIQKEYAGTPWGERAKDEINRGYGVELHEGHEDPRNLAGRGIKLPNF